MLFSTYRADAQADSASARPKQRVRVFAALYPGFRLNGSHTETVSLRGMGTQAGLHTTSLNALLLPEAGASYGRFALAGHYGGTLTVAYGQGGTSAYLHHAFGGVLRYRLPWLKAFQPVVLAGGGATYARKRIVLEVIDEPVVFATHGFYVEAGTGASLRMGKGLRLEGLLLVHHTDENTKGRFVNPNPYRFTGYEQARLDAVQLRVGLVWQR